LGAAADKEASAMTRPTKTYFKALDEARKALDKLEWAMGTGSEAKLNEANPARTERTLEFYAQLQQFIEVLADEWQEEKKLSGRCLRL
jgi:hypothetical protein